MRGDLVQAAILGTSTGGAPAATDDPGDALAARLPGDPSAEARLLVAAGIAAVRSRAGFVPDDAPVPPIPSPADAVAECPRRGSDLIVEILDSGDPDLLVEAAERLRDLKLRAPSLLLPDFLAAPQRFPGRRDEVVTALRPVLGERGRWLAHLAGKQWAWGAQTAEPVVHPADDKTWKEGSVADRLAVLARRRGATPDAARDWLAAVWKEERADERAKFLETFAAGLALADEAFLEAALDDRSAGVREIAARLLSKLPGSAFARRAEERAASMLLWSPAFKPSIAQRLRRVDASAILDANPPSEIPKEWERDGLIGKPPEGVGERAWRLTQTLAIVPPLRWCERFASTPTELITAVAASEWCAAVLRGWRDATVTFRDGAWAAALAESDAPTDATPAGRWTELVPCMSHDVAERFLSGQFRDSQRKAVPTVYTAVRGISGRWSEAFARDVLAALRRDVASDARLVDSTVKVLVESGRAWPIDVVPETLAFAESLSAEGATVRQRDAFVALLRLRQRIHQEIIP